MKTTSSSVFADSKPHYDLLDGLRGVAALLVLWYHVFEGYQFAGNQPIIEFMNHGYLAVDFFFILSGFEHSIADCFYFGAAEILSKDSALFLLVAVAGNTLGALLTAALEGRRQQPVPENEKT